MSLYLWTNFVLGVIVIFLNAILVARGETTTTSPSTRVVSMLMGIGFTIWAAYLLFVVGV